MTLRSILLGLAGAASLCGLAFFNDQLMQNTALVSDYFPLSIFGLLILFLLLINPLLRRFSSRGAFTAAELAVVVALPLFAGWIPGRGFLHYFNNVLLMPHRFAIERPGWQASPTAYQVSDIRDPVRLATQLREANESNPIIVSGLSPENRALLAASAGASNLPPDLAEAIVSTLNTCLTNHTLFELAASHADNVPTSLRLRLRHSAQAVSAGDMQLANRCYLDSLFADALESRWPALLEALPPQLLVSTNASSATVIDGYLSGLGQEHHPAHVRDIPWYAWTTPYRIWLPIVLLFCIIVAGIALAIHREWSDHEHLPYPTITFIEALLPNRTGESSPIFRQRLFWVGFLSIMGIHLYNYTAKAWGNYENLVPLNLRFDFGPISDMFPLLKQGQSWVVFSPRIFFVIIGLSYFLASDVSFSLGLAPLIYLLVLGIAASYGVSMGGDPLAPSIETFIYGGAYLGMFLVIAWTGRHYYHRIFKGALGRTASFDARDLLASRAARVALIAMILFVICLVRTGLSWPLAMLYAFILVATHIVMARVLAEGGVIWFGPSFVPSALIWGFFGARGIGPDQLLLLGVISSVLMIDSSIALMPFASSALRLLDRTHAPIGKSVLWGGAALVLGLAIAVPVTLYTQYNRGVTRINDGWATREMPQRVYESNLTTRHRLDAQGLLHSGSARNLKSKISNLKCDAPPVAAMCITIALVLLFTYCRHRFPGWPLHPMLFLVLGTWQGAWLGFSFFLGWVVKSLVTRYGGARLYQRLKPFMIGIIAGEMLGVTIPAILCAAYYLITGEPGVHFKLIPY